MIIIFLSLSGHIFINSCVCLTCSPHMAHSILKLGFVSILHDFTNLTSPLPVAYPRCWIYNQVADDLCRRQAPVNCEWLAYRHQSLNTLLLFRTMWLICVFKVAIYGGYFVACTETDESLTEQGRLQLQRVQDFAGQPRYGKCWSKALEQIHTRCREFTDETQSKIALAFTHCHLERCVCTFVSQCLFQI